MRYIINKIACTFIKNLFPFVILISAATVNAQEPEKKAEKKAKTEQCSKEKSKKCPSTCDKKAKAEKAEKAEKEKKRK